MISGLFLANVIDRPWRQYADRKVVHFAYFYLLWITIQFAIKAPGMIHEQGAIEVVRLYVLGLGLAGACAVGTVASLMAKTDLFKPLRYCGRNSIVIYLAFFLPMAATRAVLLKSGVIADIGTISAIVTAVGVLGSLCLFWAVRETPVRFLFERPSPLWLAPPRRIALQPAE